MKFLLQKTFFLLTLLFLICSCGSRKDIVYMQDIDTIGDLNKATSYQPILQPDDLLSITVSSENPEIAVPFNIYSVAADLTGLLSVKNFLIDEAGFIDFPVIGLIKLAGLSRTEAILKLRTAISEYSKDCTINFRIVNYKVSVLGEVNRPGSISNGTERLTLLQAISLAGDLTIYGKRNNILIIREILGKKTINRIDITKAGFINSPYYYLCQNDVVFVEPNKTRINSSVVGPNVSIILAAVSVIITLTTLIFRYK